MNKNQQHNVLKTPPAEQEETLMLQTQICTAVAEMAKYLEELGYGASWLG